MAQIEVGLTDKARQMCPKPANLAAVLMQNEGYVFAGVKEEEKDLDTVGVYNLEQLVGQITYTRSEDGTPIRATISDATKEEILTWAAKNAFR